MEKLTGFLMMLAVAISVWACTNTQAKNDVKIERAATMAPREIM
jgi:hypothetical protein